jgi:hypothetical protein
MAGFCSWPKPVYVIAYIRFRFGRYEHVTAHCRSLPKS